MCRRHRAAFNGGVTPQQNGTSKRPGGFAGAVPTGVLLGHRGDSSQRSAPSASKDARASMTGEPTQSTTKEQA
jgi:hypothetical protein